MSGVPELEKIVAAIERERRGADRLAQLETAAGAASELQALGDQVLDHFVQAARVDGASWTAIGGVLGVSKQGAQQRYAPAPPVDPWPSGFSAAAQAVVAHAVDEARAVGHRYLGTEHVLLGLLSEAGGPAARALAQLGVEHDEIHARVIETIGRGERDDGASLGMTPRTKRVLDAARREARRLGQRCPGPEHLLLGLCSVRQGVAHDILAGAGVREADVRSTLADMIDERMRRPARRAERVRRLPLGRG
jgi:hypothetical protein